MGVASEIVEKVIRRILGRAEWGALESAEKKAVLKAVGVGERKVAVPAKVLPFPKPIEVQPGAVKGTDQLIKEAREALMPISTKAAEAAKRAELLRMGKEYIYKNLHGKIPEKLIEAINSMLEKQMLLLKDEGLFNAASQKIVQLSERRILQLVKVPENVQKHIFVKSKTAMTLSLCSKK